MNRRELIMGVAGVTIGAAVGIAADVDAGTGKPRYVVIVRREDVCRQLRDKFGLSDREANEAYTHLCAQHRRHG